MYKYKAEKDGKVWNLTDEQAEKLLLGDCFYCGIKPEELIKEAGIDKGKTTILKFINNKNIACGPNRLNKLLFEMRKQ